MDTFLNDVRYAIRNLLKRPGFTFIAVATLALGIGANVAVFTLINGLFLKPLPFPDPDRLVYINETAPRWNLETTGITYADFAQWQKAQQAFEAALDDPRVLAYAARLDRQNPPIVDAIGTVHYGPLPAQRNITALAVLQALTIAVMVSVAVFAYRNAMAAQRDVGAVLQRQRPMREPGRREQQDRERQLQHDQPGRQGQPEDAGVRARDAEHGDEQRHQRDRDLPGGERAEEMLMLGRGKLVAHGLFGHGRRPVPGPPSFGGLAGPRGPGGPGWPGGPVVGRPWPPCGVVGGEVGGAPPTA